MVDLNAHDESKAAQYADHSKFEVLLTSTDGRTVEFIREARDLIPNYGGLVSWNLSPVRGNPPPWPFLPAPV